MMGARSVWSVADDWIVRPLKKRDTNQELEFMGTETLTVTSGESSVIGSGLTVTVAFRTRPAVKILVATALASATVAPGTMALRAPSYAALSTECRTTAARENSIIAKTIMNKTGKIIANSTVTAPRRCILG